MTTECDADGGPLKGYVLAGSIGKKMTRGPPEGYAALVNKRDGAGAPAGNIDYETDEEADCFSRTLGPLSCFGKKKKNQQVLGDFIEKYEEKERVPAPVLDPTCHGTIQPMSGWFLFGPDKDVGPFYEDAELNADIEAAIESCEGVEHMHDR